MGGRGGFQGGGHGGYQQGGGAPFNAPEGPRKRFKADDNN
jgi:hypothetical protein